MQTGIRDEAYKAMMAVTSTTNVATGTVAISAIELHMRTESPRLARKRTKIVCRPILANSMTTAIMVTAENMAIRTANRRHPPMAIEPATSPLFCRY